MANLSASDIEKLQTRRTTLLDRLNALDGGLGDKPNSRQPGSVDHDGHIRTIMWQLERIEKLIDAYDNSVNGADEFIHYGY